MSDAASPSPYMQLENLKNASPALYAFVINETVMYVGKTSRKLSSRLYGYQAPGTSQLTNIRVNELIRQALDEKQEVQIYAFEDPRPQQLGQFRIDLAAGLEDDIIRQLRPQWNGGEKPRPSLTESPPKKTDNYQVPKQSQAPASKTRPSFKVTVGKTYYRMGFFNVPVDYERYFAGDGKELEVELEARTIFANVNRTANAGGTPRIMGGTALRDWFQSHVTLGGQVTISVISKEKIAIRA